MLTEFIRQSTRPCVWASERGVCKVQLHVAAEQPHMRVNNKIKIVRVCVCAIFLRRGVRETMGEVIVISHTLGFNRTLPLRISTL